MNLNQLKPNPRNPRKITDPKLELLRKSLLEFGDLSGVVLNQRTGQLVGGHQRVKVIPENATISIINKYDKPTPTGTIADGYIIIAGEKYSYRVVDWDLTREEAANLAANKHGGEFDLGLLSQILLDLDQNNYDMDLTGFSQTEIENLVAPIDDLASEIDDNIDKDLGIKFLLEIELPNQEDQTALCEELLSRGLIVRVKNG